MYLPEQLRKFTILPVLVVDSVTQAVALTEALRAGGMLAVEVTLRTQVALSAMREIKLSFPDILLGAGTVNTPADMEAAAEAGADFAVSPGLTRLLAEQARSMRMPFLRTIWPCPMCCVSGVPGWPGEPRSMQETGS